MSSNRHSDGRWKKGASSPNPSGKSKLDERPAGRSDVRALARRLSHRSIELMGEIMEDPEAPHKDRITAASKIYDVAWGKPGVRKEEQSFSAEDIKNLMPQVVIASPQSIPNSDPDPEYTRQREEEEREERSYDV